MRKVSLLILLLVLSSCALQGCSIAYHNVKKVSAGATNAITPYGKLDNANTYFYSTVDVILGAVIKKETIPPANLDFLNP